MRDILARARRGVREHAQRVARDESWTRHEVASAQDAREKRLTALEQRVAVLRNPGSGIIKAQLGELTLFQHLVVVKSASRTHSIELAGLDVRFEAGQTNHSLYLTAASGQVYRAKYPRHPSPADPQEQWFDEERVRDFEVDIRNAAAKENSFRSRLPQQLKEAEDELSEAQADTSALDKARERQQRLHDLNRQDPRRKAADAALEEARKEWEKTTGRVPPR
ncbi:hypothetical protein [Streptomyces sp. SAS_276]|uniref:hypothetical protein n=1 Tax=Streptomyces sp. SAS_276 TaxID=3412745 RepID=UPI00403C6B29